MINVDAKILSKILAERIKKILPKIISTDQTAYISERYIGEPSRTIADVLYYTKFQNKPGILFAADFAAAFDSISHSFMLKTLKKFGFTENLIRWIKILHTDLESCVLNDGTSTGYFKIKRGTRQ